MSQFSPPRVRTEYTPRQAPPNGDIPRRRPVPRAKRTTPLTVNRQRLTQRIALILAVMCECVLLLIALVPLNVWANYGYPNGPIPSTLAPLVAGLFYILPALTGALTRRWQMAVVLATLPAWLDLGLFAIAAASKVGPFYLGVDPHSTGTVGTLELFAVLGGLGWLARVCALGLWARTKGGSW